MRKGIVGLLLICFGCAKNSPPPPDNNISILYKNTSGNYLFNNNQNVYKEDSLKLFSIVNGIAYPLDSGYNYTMPKSASSSAKYLYLAFMGWESSFNVYNAYNTVVIHLKKNVNDTLVFYPKKSVAFSHDSIWYNGILQSSNVFDVIK